MAPVRRSRAGGRVLLAVLASALVAAGCSAGLLSREENAAPSGDLGAATDPSASPAATLTPQPAPTASAAPDFDKGPSAADDPKALAQQLVMVERAVRDPQITGSELECFGHLQQLVYSQLNDYPDWQESVLAALPVAVRPAVTGSLAAGRELRSMTGAIPKSLPDWKILQPAPVETLLGYYHEAEAQFGVPWYHLASIHLVESRMGRIRGLSSAGAQGPMQFMPSTWAQYGKGDINSDHDAILAAARYLRAAGAPGDMARALYAYNHSIRYVRALTLYAEVMHQDPDAYRGYHGWQVYYPTQDGIFLLPAGG